MDKLVDANQPLRKGTRVMARGFFKFQNRPLWLVACSWILLGFRVWSGTGQTIPQWKTDGSRFAARLQQDFATTSLSGSHQALLRDAYVSFLELNTSSREGDTPRDTLKVVKSTDPRVVLEQTAFSRPQSESAIYDYLLLANGVKILLISKKNEAFNGIYVTINSGFADDPHNLEGLAHFHEHLLTCGSLFEPNETSYKSYISSILGNCNAMTQNSATQFRVSFIPSGTRGVIERLRYLLTNATFPTSVFQQELNAIDNEFLLRKQEYEELLVVKDAIMDHSHPLASHGVGAKTLMARVKDKGVDYMRAQLFVFNALSCIGPRIQVVAVTGEPIETYRQTFIENFSVIPSNAVTDITDFGEKIRVMGLNKHDVEVALAEQLESRRVHQDRMSFPVLTPGQYGITLYQEQLDTLEYKASFLFPVETELTNDFNIAAFFHVLRSVELPLFRGSSGLADITTLINFGDQARLVYAIGFLVGFGYDEPFEDGRVGTVLREIFEFLEIIFRVSAEKLERLCRFEKYQKVPGDVDIFSLMQVLNLDGGDPQRALNEALDPRSWNYTRLMDEKRRFLIPNNVVIHATGPSLKGTSNNSWGTLKVVRQWSINYWRRPLEPHVLRDCAMVVKRGVEGTRRQSHLHFPKLKRQELNVTIYAKDENSFETQNGAPPVEVYFHGVSPNDAVALQKEAEALEITLDPNSTRALPQYFEVVTVSGGVVRVAHEHTPNLRTPYGHLTFSLESPLIEISVVSEAMMRILHMSLNRIITHNAGGNVVGEVSLGRSRPMTLDFILYGNSFEVEKQFMKILEYMKKIAERYYSFFFLQEDYAFSSRVFEEYLAGINRDAETIMKGYEEAVLTPFNIPSFTLLRVLREIPPEDRERRVLGAFRLVLQNCNPSLVVLGNFRRREAEGLAHAVGKALRFVNSHMDTYDFYRTVQLPLSPYHVEVVPKHNPITEFSGFRVAFQVPHDPEVDQKKAVNLAVLAEHLNGAVTDFYRYKKGMCYVPKVKFETTNSRALYAHLTLTVASRTHSARDLLGVFSEWKQAARLHIEKLSLESISGTLKNWGYVEAVVRPKSMYYNIRSVAFMEPSVSVLDKTKTGLYLIRMSKKPEEHKKYLLELFDTYIADGGPQLRELRIVLQRDIKSFSEAASESDIVIPKFHNNTIRCSSLDACRVIMSQLSVLPVRREIRLESTAAEYQTALKVAGV